MIGKKLKNGIEIHYYINDIGETIEYYLDKRKWYIYVLINENNPIYVGQTTNIKNRILNHKKSNKEFDSYIIANICHTEVQANASEKTLISLLCTMYSTMTNKYSNKYSSNIIKL
jgi:hypothetical protein